MLEEEDNPSEAAVVQRDKLRRLTSSDEWRMVLAFIEGQSSKRVLEIMTTVETDEAVSKRINFTKGEYNGLQLVKVFVEQQVSAAEDLVDLFKEQAKLENGANV